MELEAQGSEALSAITESRESSEAHTLELAGRPIAMFGCHRIAVGDLTYGLVWLVGTDDLVDRGRFVVENTNKWVSDLTKGCDISGNVVDCRNEVSIRWLRWMGYSFPRQRDIGGFPFLEFFQSHRS